jgi:putative addiction module component (TIGR02574 family)
MPFTSYPCGARHDLRYDSVQCLQQRRETATRAGPDDKLTADQEEAMPLETETVETLEAAALQLTPAERARLVERLIATLDADPEVEEAWASEVERRQAEIETGQVSLMPGPETLNKVKAEFE